MNLCQGNPGQFDRDFLFLEDGRIFRYASDKKAEYCAEETWAKAARLYPPVC